MTVNALFEAEFPLFVLIASGIFGMLIGSFLNVVIYRLPVMMHKDWQGQARDILELPPEPESEPFNLVVPRSRCPECGHQITALENIPVISYLVLRGKCSQCKTGISFRYPLIELFTGVVTALVIWRFGLNPAGLACCVFSWALIAMSMIDYDHTILPDSMTIPMLWLGLIVNYFALITYFPNAFWGAIFGYMSLWTVYQLFKLVTGKEGMGHGDFKLLGMLCAWTGWQMLPLIIIFSSLAGAIIGGSLIAMGRDRSKPIPFGPYLAIAGWIALMWGPEITENYLQFMAS